MSLRIMGIKTKKNGFDWATLEGPTRDASELLNYASISVPSGGRPQALAWLWDEVTELVAVQSPDQVVIRPAEGQNLNVAVLERSQVDGVLLASLAALNLPCAAKKSATVRADFGARSNLELDAALDGFRALADVPPSADRRSPIVAALAALAE